MSNNSIAPFFVGQEVVALDTSSERYGHRIIKGNVYTVINVVLCSCGKWLVQLKELYAPNINTICCDKTNVPYCGGPACKFAPIITNFQSITFEKVIEQELASVN